MEDKILRTMRTMAWERAKGELFSMGQTYWGDYEKFEEMDKAIRQFISEVEGNGWQE